MLVFDELKKNDPHLRVLAWAALAGMGVLFIGLWYVQIISHKHFVENQQAQSFRTVRIPAIRGKIVDQEGRPIAENQPNYNVSLYLEEMRAQFKSEFTNLWRRFQPPLVKQPRAVNLFGWKVFNYSKSVPAYKITKNQRRSIEELARYRVVSNLLQNLSANLQQPVEISYAQFADHYANQLALPLPVASISNYTQVARFLEQRDNPPGLDLEMQPLRYYPYHSTAAHLVGCMKFNNNSAEGEESFFNFRLPDYQGLVGIEGAFDAELRGRAGVKSVLVNNLGYRQSENIWVPAEPGKNVVLTINLELQQAAEKALAEATGVQKHPLRGAVVVMDPNSGDILAMASAPSYDPNLFIPRISPADWERLLDENLKPQRNRATQENYHPGSIFKIVIALAALEAGLDPHEIIYSAPDPANPSKGHIVVGRKIRDTAPPGDYDFRRAFIRSSNTYFITNGLRAGIENIYKIGSRLHFGERTGLPTLQDSPGAFPNLKRIRSHWSRGETAMLCIGQGELAVTPVQMAVMVSAVANGGKVFWPRLVDRIDPQDLTSGETAERFPKARLRDSLGVSASTLRIVREAMLADVEDTKEGTGKRAAVEGFRVCGKTGTAQVKDEDNVTVDHNTWFASYAPYENPRYVVIVLVESGTSGSETPAPVAGKIYQKIKEMESRGKNTALVQTTTSQAGLPALR